MKFWKQQLTTKIASSFLLLSLLTVGVVGGVAFFSAREALQKAAFNKLSVAATLKEEEITRWFESQQRDFLLITEFPDVKAKISKILDIKTKTSESDYQTAHNIIYQYLREVNKVKPNLQEISIIDRTNRIILSTNKNRQGKYEPSANMTEVEKVKRGSEFVPIFYVSSDTGKLTVTLKKTWSNSAGIRQGMILANLNLERIDEIVREKTGLGKSGETYLVGSISNENRFISKEGREKPLQNVTSYGVEQAMLGISGSELYSNHKQIPVLGVYRWLNEQEFALLVEMSQVEAFAPARRLANIIVMLGLTSAGVLLIGVYWLSRQLEISRKQLEDYSHQLELKAQEAETANRAKSEFLANMSHELRTPLNAILGFAQLMERDRMLNPQQHNSLATINRSGEHLLALINDVLEMSKIEAGRTVLNPESFNLHSLLQIIKDMFQLRASAKGLTLEFETDPNLPHFVVGDRGKLRQVSINLLGNAIKFTQKGGVTLRVKVKAWHKQYPGEKLCTLYFEVEDTGKGINPEELDKIFDPFVQTASGAQARGGTGLGLAISRQFIRLMGGDIFISSVLEKGSTFYFEIKLALAKRSKTEKSTIKRQVIGLAPSQESYRILVVDDRQENRDLLAELLSKVAFDVRTANNGIEAIEQWQEWKPHFIWMDMRMPLMDGYEATKKIKARSGEYATAIVALTASAFEEQRAAILAAGCDDLVHKPFQQEVIFETMGKYLEVKYIYKGENEDRDLEEDSNSDMEQEIKLTPESLSVMSKEWIANLNQAAIEVDSESLLQLIEQVPESHKTLADQLRKLTSRYDFDTIIELSST